MLPQQPIAQMGMPGIVQQPLSNKFFTTVDNNNKMNSFTQDQINLNTLFANKINAEIGAVNVILNNVAQLDVRTTSLRTDSGALDQRTTSLENAETALQHRVTSLETDNKALEKRSTTLETATDNLQNRATTLETDRDDLQNRATTLETDRDTLQARTITLETDRDSLQDRTTNLENGLKNKTAKLKKQLADGMFASATNFKYAREDCQNMQANYEAARGDYKKISEETTTLKDIIHKAEKKVVTLKETFSNHKATSDERNKKHDIEIATQAIEIKNLVESSGALFTALSLNSEKITTHDKDISRNEHTINSNSTKADHQFEKISSISTSVKGLKVKMKNINKTLDPLILAHNAISSSVMQVQLETRNSLNEHQKEGKTLLENMNRTLEQAIQIKETVFAAEARIAPLTTLEHEVECQKNEIIQIKDTLLAAETRIASLSILAQVVDSLKFEMTQLRNTVSKQDTLISIQQSSIEELRAYNLSKMQNQKHFDPKLAMNDIKTLSNSTKVLPLNESIEESNFHDSQSEETPISDSPISLSFISKSGNM